MTKRSAAPRATSFVYLPIPMFFLTQYNRGLVFFFFVMTSRQAQFEEQHSTTKTRFSILTLLSFTDGAMEFFCTKYLQLVRLIHFFD